MKRNVFNGALLCFVLAILVWFAFIFVNKIVNTNRSTNHIEAMGYNKYLVDSFVSSTKYTIIDFASKPEVREEYDKWKGDMFKN